MIALPKLSPEGYRLLVYKLRNTDPSKVQFGEATKAFCMFNDVQISEDGPTNGYVVIFDMKGVKLGHLAKVQFGPLRTFMNYIQVSCLFQLLSHETKNLHLFCRKLIQCD